MNTLIPTLRSVTGFELILGFYRIDFSTLFTKNERHYLRQHLLSIGISPLEFTHSHRLRHYKYIRQHFHIFETYSGSDLDLPLHKLKRRKLNEH